jgi:hypothetical protein
MPTITNETLVIITPEIMAAAKNYCWWHHYTSVNKGRYANKQKNVAKKELHEIFKKLGMTYTERTHTINQIRESKKYLW